MKLKKYIKMEAKSNKRQHDIYVERNKDYASEEDSLENSFVVSEICWLLKLDIGRCAVDCDWFRLIDKLVRERNKHRQDNLDDAMNYLRRIMAHWEDE